jgi:hypothetical protein
MDPPGQARANRNRLISPMRRLGGPASHGCVRLHPSHAAMLHALVERNGCGNTLEVH